MTDSGTATTGFLVLEALGTMAFAVSGVMAAARARMDWLGAIVLALVVAIGGGTLRDLFLGRLPVAWLEQAWPVLVADAAGLSAFVVLGTQIGLEADLLPLLAVMLGVLTGVGGGVIRDLLTGSKPAVLVGEIYAVAGVVGAVCFAALEGLGVNPQVSVWTSVALIFSIRLLAIRFDWHLPKALAVGDGLPEGQGPGSPAP